MRLPCNQELKADRRRGSGRMVCSEEGAAGGYLVFCIIQQTEEKGAWGWALQLVWELTNLLSQTAIDFDGDGVRATFLQRKAEVCSIIPLGRWTPELEVELHKIEQMQHFSLWCAQRMHPSLIFMTIIIDLIELCLNCDWRGMENGQTISKSVRTLLLRDKITRPIKQSHVSACSRVRPKRQDKSPTDIVLLTDERAQAQMTLHGALWGIKPLQPTREAAHIPAGFQCLQSTKSHQAGF